MDFVNEEVIIPRDNTKSGKPKILTISPELERLLKSTPKTSHLVFVNVENRRHQNFSINFKKYRIKLSIRDGITAHCLRHTTATYLIRLGYPLAFISKYLGHSDIRVTMNMYGHLIKDDLIELSNKMGGTIRVIKEEPKYSEEIQ